MVGQLIRRKQRPAERLGFRRPSERSRACEEDSHGWEQVLCRPGGISVAAAQLRQLGQSKSLSEGKLLHSLLRTRGIDRLTFIGNCLIEMYANCGCPHDARIAFCRLPDPNVFSWNMLIKAYAQNNHVQNAFHVFCSTPLRDSVTWNAMISAFARHGLGSQALHLFYQMKEEGFVQDKISFIGALDACILLRPVNIHLGRDIHAEVVGFGFEQNVLVSTAVLNMYGKCGNLGDAKIVFEQLLNRDVAMWNAIIGLFARAGNKKDALFKFGQMLKCGFSPDHVSFISVLEACALDEGQIVHAAVLDSSYELDAEVSTAIFSMYGKHGSLWHATYVFNRMPFKSLVVWNAMIAVFSQNNRSKDALRLYKQMHLEGLKPDKSTYTTLLDACANLASIEEGQDVYRAVVCHQHDEDILLCNSLISFYGECGGMDEARKVFDRMLHRDRISWTAIMTASVQNGQSMEALRLFQLMQLQGFQPDDVTFISILTGCGRSGLLEEGVHFFVSMNKDHGIAPSGEHYLCMIYLLARAGRLDDAEELIENVPSGKVGMAWLSLLGACKFHYDIERGFKAAENCVKFIPGKVLSYILLSNLYAEDQMWPTNVLSNVIVDPTMS